MEENDESNVVPDETPVKKKKFKITIYGCADYHEEDPPVENIENFQEFVKNEMKAYLEDLEAKLKKTQYLSVASYMDNFKIFGHGNDEYPDER